MLVLVHEFAHLMRRDWLIQTTGEIARAINWFNPLFWIACARLRRESEYACDDIVLDLGIGGTSYATHLIDLARTFSVHGRTWLPAPSIARPSTLERRVRAMLNPHTDRRPVRRYAAPRLRLFLLATAVPIAAASQGLVTTNGRVTDPSGLPLPDAAVRLASTSSDAVYEGRTDASGSFELAGVPPGDTCCRRAIRAFPSQRQRVRFNGAVTLALQLQVGTLKETVTVRGGGIHARGKRGSTQGHDGAIVGDSSRLWNDRCRRQYQAAAQGEGRSSTVQAGVGGRKSGRRRASAGIDWDGWPGEERRGRLARAGRHGGRSDQRSDSVGVHADVLNCQPIEVRMFVTVAFKLDR